MISRRSVLATAASVTTLPTMAGGTAGPKRDLVPHTPSSAPNYWSTWGIQNSYNHVTATFRDTAEFPGRDNTARVEAELTERHLLGRGGWADSIFPDCRDSLYLVLDEGWQQAGYADTEPHRERFPNLKGSAVDKLVVLNSAIKARGWRGTGLWCRNPAGPADASRIVRTFKAAGISYCKLDQGDEAHDFITVRNAIAAPLTVEHVLIEGPLNGDWQKDGRFELAQRYPAYADTIDTTFARLDMLQGTDVYRTYDVTPFLSAPTTLDRAAKFLAALSERPDISTLLNVEDEVYIAAALGCAMGVMRHPFPAHRADGIEDYAFVGPRRIKSRMDEVVRALRWQRIAPPFPGGGRRFSMSAESLTDSWQFGAYETWFPRAYRKTAFQGAPAVIARDMALPEVRAPGLKPFVFGSRFPNGAIAIGAIERTLIGRPWFMPACHVRLDVGAGDGPVGVFGDFGTLSLLLTRPRQHRQVWAQDLKSNQAVNITRLVEEDERSITLNRDLIRRIGLMAATPGDVSSPGMVIRLLD